MHLSIFRINILLFSLFFVSACQQVTLHVAAPHWNAEQRVKFEQDLPPHLTVNYTHVEIPDNFSKVALVMNPAFSDIQLLNQLSSKLSELGYSNVTEYRFPRGRHFYHIDHLGLYIRPDKTQTMPLYLQSENCKAQSTLLFLPQRQWQLEFEVNGVLQKQNGSWQRKENEVELRIKEQVVKRFIYKTVMRKTQFGLREAIVLTPTTYAEEPIQLSALNCQFTVIFID